MTEVSTIWRLIEYDQYDGSTNMAIDEAILEAYLQELVPPTLRFYGFTPPCVSVGYNQKIPETLVLKAAEKGYSVVKRPTGGRAVLHFSDFTYSFIAGSSIAGSSNSNEYEILSSSVSTAYKQICLGLQMAFESLGVKLELGDSQLSYRDKHDCFGVTTGSDLHYQGKKIIGSAQLRRKHAVLQHGSILLNQNQEIMPLLLEQPVSKERHANLFEIIESVSIDFLQGVIKQGFERAFHTSIVVSKLSDMEIALAKNLNSKYLVPNLF